MGGIRVERARRWMKLILAAVTQLASIAIVRRVASFWGAYLGWQDDGVEMGIVRSVRLSRSKLRVLRPAYSAKARIPELEHPSTSPPPSTTPTTTQPPQCLPYPGQLALAYSHPLCDPRQHALSSPHTAHMRLTRTLPITTEPPQKMRLLSHSRVTPLKSGGKMLLRA